MSIDMYLLDSSLDQSGKFPLREVLDNTQFTSGGAPIFRVSESYGPRPITADNKLFYFASSEALIKVRYNIDTHTFERGAVWAFRNPQNRSAN